MKPIVILVNKKTTEDGSIVNMTVEEFKKTLEDVYNQGFADGIASNVAAVNQSPTLMNDSTGGADWKPVTQVLFESGDYYR